LKSTVRHFNACRLAILLGAGILSVPARSWAEAPERPAEGYYAQPRVEFSFSAEAAVSLNGEDFTSPMKWDYSDVETLLRETGASQWKRLFSEHSPEQLDQLRKAGEARRGIKLANLNNWYTVVLPSDEAAVELAARLAKNPRIRSASVTPLPVMFAADIAPATPNWLANQGYQAAAPAGTGITSAWAMPGGSGQGIRVLHCEGGWVLDHEDYDLTYTGGGNSGDSGWWNHGTACVSILGARNNGYGVTGMTPLLDGLFSHGIMDAGGPAAWIASMGYLNVGDVISASWGYSGTPVPGQVCVCNCGQFGGVPAEANQADFDAIQTVTANGYIVVNSASNGSMPLDDAFYGGAYNLNVRDSGALLIGAIDPGGNPTCWTNHGSRVDAHAWGSAVYSAGYGDLFSGGGDTRQYYTSSFGGTSSACPIVSGCVAATQGAFKSATGTVLDAWQFRSLLRTTGTPQTGSFSKLISNQPDVPQLIAAALALTPDGTPPVIAHMPLGNTADNVGPYAVSVTLSDASGIAAADLHHRVDGGAWSSSPLSPSGPSWVGSIPGQPAGSVIDYYLTATDGAALPNTATSATWTFTVLASADGIVLLTPSASPLSGGTEWATALTAAGYDGTIMNVDNLDGVILGPQTDALIVLLGIYSSNYVIPAGSAMATAIESFVNAGGKVYLEGGDSWAFDPIYSGGHNFNALFGLNGDSDGGADLSNATGHGPLAGSWTYTGANNWIDRLSTAGAFLLLSNDAAGYNCGYYQTGPRTTAGVSFELAGLSGFQPIIETLFGEALFNVLPGYLAVSPPSLSGTAMEGGADSETLTLTNTGHRTLNWNVNAAAQLFANAPAQLVHEPRELAKGEADPRPGAVITAVGGPDPFGYVWSDSDQPGGPAVNFQDISATGTALSLGDDVNQGPFSLGFPFTYYGLVFGDVRICSNGFLSFVSTINTFINQPLPSGGEPQAVIAPFWDDLNPGVGGTVHVQAFADRFVVQWTGVPHFSNSGSYTFQVILHADNSIEFQYGAMGEVTSATVGIENIDASMGLQVVFNAPYLHNDMAIRLAPWTGFSAVAGTLAPGQSTNLDVSMSAVALTAGVYHSTVQVNTNELPGSVSVPVEFTVTPGPRAPAQVTGQQLIRLTTYEDYGYADYVLDFPDVTQDVDGNPLSVDSYTFYYSYNPYAPFPAGWSYAWSSATSEFYFGVSFYPPLFFRVTAHDTDGVLLASPQAEGASTLPVSPSGLPILVSQPRD